MHHRGTGYHGRHVFRPAHESRKVRPQQRQRWRTRGTCSSRPLRATPRGLLGAPSQLIRTTSLIMWTVLFCCPTKTSSAGWTAGAPAGKRVVAVKRFSRIYRMGVLRLLVFLVNGTPVQSSWLRPTICIISASVVDSDSSGYGDSDPYVQLVHDGSQIYMTDVVQGTNTPSWSGACHTFDSEPGKQ